MIPYARLVLGAALLVLTPHPSLADAVTVADAKSRAVAIVDASRIVSLGGSVTEILYALGRERQIVAVDSTSLFPAAALRDKANVGYLRQLSPEGVLGTAPSAILALDGIGPKETVAVLEKAAVPLVHIPDRFTGEGILDKIRLVAQAVGADKAGACLADAVKADLDALARIRRQITRPRRVLFLLSFVNGRPMVAGRRTAADGIIALAGGENANNGFDGYKLMNDEALIGTSPDVVLMMQRDSHPMDAASVFAHPALALTPAAKSKDLVAMGALYLLGFGPRTARAARDLAQRLHPELAGEKLPSDARDPNAACRS